MPPALEVQRANHWITKKVPLYRFIMRINKRIPIKHSLWYVVSTHRQKVVAIRASLVAQTVKRLPTTRDTQVRSLGREDPLEKAMATHSSTLAWKILWTEEPGRLQSTPWTEEPGRLQSLP